LLKEVEEKEEGGASASRKRKARSHGGVEGKTVQRPTNRGEPLSRHAIERDLKVERRALPGSTGHLLSGRKGVGNINAAKQL